ncbi:MAG: hypothetical protein A2148_08610 [Chloroflexi bacterium RBG_16_68_14]|nr:MAG: hypothetical protein A2148_08610 [Chloroflexi bacterium RBG_16_68_14]
MPTIRTADEGKRREFPRSPAPEELAALLTPYDNTAVSPPLGARRLEHGEIAPPPEAPSVRGRRLWLARLPGWVPIVLSVAALALGVWVLLRPAFSTAGGAGPGGSARWTLDTVAAPQEVTLKVQGPNDEPWVRQVAIIVSTEEATFSLPVAIADGYGQRALAVRAVTANEDGDSPLSVPVLRPGERFWASLAGDGGAVEGRVPLDVRVSGKSVTPPAGAATSASATPAETPVATTTPQESSTATATPDETPAASGTPKEDAQ